VTSGERCGGCGGDVLLMCQRGTGWCSPRCQAAAYRPGDGGCVCDGAAYYSAEQNAARVPFIVSRSCPVHGALEQAGRGVMESIQAMPTGRLLQELRETLLALGAKRTDGVLQARADQLEEEVLRRMAW
jgi:hypothetical protein